MINPMMVRIACSYPAPAVDDIPSAVGEAFAGSGIRIPDGGRIALAAGSRGIANLPEIVSSVAKEVRRRGGKPFVVPAMGSHGGATADGQSALLAGYGVSEKALGLPVVSSMETVELTPDGFPNRVFMDRAAWESDGVVLINRIKAHTDYHGFPESGLLKMAVIGLGKHRQASEIHSWGIEGLTTRILPTAKCILETGKILLGIGIVENALDRTMELRAVLPSDFEREEREMLALSKRNMPRLPTDAIDVLVIDEMGKDISGVGIDPNIIGRIRVRGQEEPERPCIASILVTRLTEASHGNALGMGLADVITRELYDRIDFHATEENAVTSSFLERGKTPLVAADASQAWAWALRAAAVPPDREVRAVRIMNTLKLHELHVSIPVLEELHGRADIRVIGSPRPLLDEDRLFPF